MLNRRIKITDESNDVTDSGKAVHSSLQRKLSVTYDFQLLDDLLPEGASEDDEVIIIATYIRVAHYKCLQLYQDECLSAQYCKNKLSCKCL